jgi:hypothetical protein
MQIRYLKYAIFFLIITSGTSLFAQIDNPMGGLAIPKAKTKVTPSIAPAKADLPSSVVPPTKSYTATDLTKTDQKEFSMIKKDEFVNRGTEFQDRVDSSVKSKGESNEVYRGNIDYGVIKTKSPSITLNVRDFGAQDGDRIKVTLNDKILISNQTLYYNSQPILITLYEGFNDLRIEALNQGTSGPNTAEFIIYDLDNTQLAGSEWNLATGFHAKFIIEKIK